MHKRWTKIIVLFLLPLIATGCWDSQDIEEIDITTAVVVDKTDTGYSFAIEIASYTNVQSEQGGAPQSKKLKGDGPTFVEARNDVERKSDRPINLSGVQCVIFTEKMVYEDIMEYMYRYRDNSEYRKTVYAAVTPETPDDLLAAYSESNTLVGVSINDTLESLVKDGQIFEMTMGDILSNLESKYNGYLIPGIGLKENEITFIGYYVMDKGACKGFIPANECYGIVLFYKQIPKFLHVIDYEGKPMTLEISLKMNRPDIRYADGQAGIALYFDCTATVAYMKEKIEITDNVREEIGETLKNSLTSFFMNTIDTSKEMQCDYLNLHEFFRIHYPDVYKDMDWGQVYPNADISVAVSVKMKEGSINYRPKEEKE